MAIVLKYKKQLTLLIILSKLFFSNVILFNVTSAVHKSVHKAILNSKKTGIETWRSVTSKEKSIASEKILWGGGG